MIQGVLFIFACLAWQALKNKLRGPKQRGTSRLVVSLGRVLAECGCETDRDPYQTRRIVKPCQAHRAMMEAGQ
jgi:hypothetical protein